MPTYPFAHPDLSIHTADLSIDTRDQGHWVLGYVLLAGSISAALLYRLGPPSHPRTLDLLQWTLQFLGLALIALSSHHPLYR